MCPKYILYSNNKYKFFLKYIPFFEHCSPQRKWKITQNLVLQPPFNAYLRLLKYPF